MSYLPHESKTYKEPEEPILEEPPEITFQNLPPASSLSQDNSSSPEIILKHYSYHPHPPPVLPGPSVHEDVAMAERLAETRRRRSKEMEESKTTMGEEESSTTQKIISVDFIPEVTPSTVLAKPEKEESTTSRKPKTSRSNQAVKKKSSSKNLTEKKKKPPDEFAVNYCFVADKNFNSKSEEELVKRSSSKLIKNKSKKILFKPKRVIGSETIYEDQIVVCDKSVQCIPEEEGALKITIIPSIVYSLIQALALLIHELKEESPSDADTIQQLEKFISSLSYYKVEDDFSFDATFSDARRLDEIYKDVSKYLEEAYGTGGKLSKRMEVKKQLFVNLFEKNYELELLSEKIKNVKCNEVDLNEYSFDNPEVELQNKILENEQLRAKIEFNYMEFRRYHKAFAENDWEITKSRDEINALKKYLTKEENTESSSKTSTDCKTKDKKKQTK